MSVASDETSRQFSPLELSPHAKEQARLRGISEAHIETVLGLPLEVREGRKKRTEFVGWAEGRKLTVVRGSDGVIVTVYWV